MKTLAFILTLVTVLLIGKPIQKKNINVSTVTQITLPDSLLKAVQRLEHNIKKLEKNTK